MVNVPAPGRFAVHKCATSQMRATAVAAKIRKDLDQAQQVFAALLELRPADITLAFAAATQREKSFMERVQAGINRLDADISVELRKLM